MPWQKGQSGNPNGRAKGRRNQLTEDIRTIARGFVDDPEYRDALKARITAGTAGTMEQLLWHYGYGRPLADTPGDGTAPTAITIHF